MPISRALLRRQWVAVALVAITVVALALRLHDLGGRVAHFDEARVGIWTLWYLEHGFWEYRPVVHGPFLFHVNEFLFAHLGVSDWSMRLVVAVIAGLSPLAAWLYRDYLTDVEVVAFGGFLALTPVLLYYGRFSRNDVILATAMLVAFGFVLRALASRRSRYLYPAVVAAAFGFAMKENAVLYLMCWAGAAVAVVGHQLVYDRVAARVGRTPGDRDVVGLLTPPYPLDRRWVRDGLGSLAVGLGVLVSFYAPRGSDQPGLGELVSAPWRLPAVIDASVVDAVRAVIDHWVVGHRRGGDLDRTFVDDLGFYLDVLAEGALVVALLGLLGIAVQYMHDDGPRWIVVFAAVWTLLSVGGYPYAAGTPWDSAWIAVHMAAPMTLVAAVGAADLVDLAVQAVEDEDVVSLVGSGLIILAAVGLLLWPAYGLVYVDHSSADNRLVQGAQPGAEWERPIDEIEALVDDNDGDLDILYFGSELYVQPEEIPEYRPGFEPWLNRVPLQWYALAFDAEVDSTLRGVDLREAIDEHDPPIIITDHTEASTVEQYVDGYELYTVDRRWIFFTTHIYLDLDRLDTDR